MAANMRVISKQVCMAVWVCSAILWCAGMICAMRELSHSDGKRGRAGLWINLLTLIPLVWLLLIFATSKPVRVP